MISKVSPALWVGDRRFEYVSLTEIAEIGGVSPADFWERFQILDPVVLGGGDFCIRQLSGSKLVVVEGRGTISQIAFEKVRLPHGWVSEPMLVNKEWGFKALSACLLAIVRFETQKGDEIVEGSWANRKLPGKGKVVSAIGYDKNNVVIKCKK